jgi:hypothetical protein
MTMIQKSVKRHSHSVKKNPRLRITSKVFYVHGVKQRTLVGGCGRSFWGNCLTYLPVQCPETSVTNLMFCLPCIAVYQYNKTNVMNFLFNLLRIKCLYMLRTSLAHPLEALHKRHLVNCVRVMSVPLQSWCIQLK